MSSPSLDGRRFRGVENYFDGDFDETVLFDYHQHNELVWATFSGKRIRIGSLVGQIDGDLIRGGWHYISGEGHYLNGVVELTVCETANGRLRINERWAAMTGLPRIGESALEEIAACGE